MILWIDAQISPAIAAWINRTFPDIKAQSVRSLHMQYATDMEIFSAAKQANVIIMSKDNDFITLIEAHGTPPSLIWITSGNTSNSQMKEILSAHLQEALSIIKTGEPVVEIRKITGES